MVSSGVSVAAGLEQMLAEGRVSRGKSGACDNRQAPAHGVWPTRIGRVDAALPGGGLRRGATHEWFTEARRGGEWAPALSVVLGILAGARPESGEVVVFVGRRCWPVLWAARQPSWLFVDPECDAARFWAIDQALRCPGVDAVIADATRLDMAGSRRLQLAAEAGSATGFLLRPSWERGVISAAETRWEVRFESPPCAEERRPRWGVELTRCKGASLSAHGEWVFELVQEAGRETCALRVPADVVGGSGETESREERVA